MAGDRDPVPDERVVAQVPGGGPLGQGAVVVGGARRGAGGVVVVDDLAADPAGGVARELGAEQLEAAVLDRSRTRLTYRRIDVATLAQLLSQTSTMTDLPRDDA